jgi:hypothetical protein
MLSREERVKNIAARTIMTVGLVFIFGVSSFAYSAQTAGGNGGTGTAPASAPKRSANTTGSASKNRSPAKTAAKGPVKSEKPTAKQAQKPAKQDESAAKKNTKPN